MKNTYRLEKWQYHQCVETKEFTNKKDAQKWLKNSGWWTTWEYGQCAIYIYKNNTELTCSEIFGSRDRWR